MSGDHKTLIKGNPSQYVKLNIGGCLFYTTIGKNNENFDSIKFNSFSFSGNLTKCDCMLRSMFSGTLGVLTDSEGKIF